jgi:hypothetical protein
VDFKKFLELLEAPFYLEPGGISRLSEKNGLHSGEIGILDSTHNLERTIPFTEADRKL